MHRYDVVVVGAGPAGLLVAADLAVLGRSVAVVDRRSARDCRSRAFAVMPRTMEVLRQRRLADAVLTRGRPQDRVRLPGGAALDFSRVDSPYPYVTVAPQSVIEAQLERYARESGVDIVRDQQVVGVALDRDGVEVRLMHERADGSRATGRTAGAMGLGADYLVAADGAHSTVRDLMGVPFPGRTAIRSAILADVEADTPAPTDAAPTDAAPTDDSFTDDLSIRVGVDCFSFVAPYGDGNRYRVMAWDRRHQPEPTEPVRDGELAALVERTGRDDFTIRKIEHAWRFRSDERQLDSYRHGRVLFVGDAAHVHSPVGGQGMNTGIQDAANLAWKLAAACGGADSRVLDSYQDERHPIGRRVLRMSAAMLRVSTMPPPFGPPLRRVGGAVVRLPGVGRTVVGVMGGTDLRYPGSGLVGRRAATIPTVDGPVVDCQSGLRFLLVTPDPVEALDPGTVDIDIPVVRRTDKGPAVLVRPDGYIAWSGDIAAGELVPEQITADQIAAGDIPDADEISGADGGPAESVESVREALDRWSAPSRVRCRPTGAATTARPRGRERSPR